MGKKVTLDNFSKEVEKVLEEYQDDVSKNLDAIIKAMGQKGSQLLRNESSKAFPKGQGQSTGAYSKGWTATYQKNRLYAQVTIHNSKNAGLAHLLEHGHVIKSGGRTVGKYSGKEHIEPVEKILIEEYEKEVINKL